LELFYRVAGKYTAANSGRAKLATSPSGDWQSVEVAIPLSKDRKRALEGLRIDPPDGATLEVKDVTLVFGEPPPAAPEDWKAGMLPFFWGNFDEHRAAQNARALQGIDVPTDKAPRKSLELRFPPVADKRTGNYLKLCVRLPGYAPPSKASPWATVHHGGSWQSAGEVTLRYGAPASSFVFSVVQPTAGVPGLSEALVRSFAEECKPYLVRISAQHAWSSQAIDRIDVSSSVPIVIESANVLAGD